MTVQTNVIKLFNRMVTEEFIEGFYTQKIMNGVVTNFIPTTEQSNVLDEMYQPIKVSTLFTVDERNNASLYDLLYTQVLHYIEVYGLNNPGQFNLVKDGKDIVKFNYIQGISYDQLVELVHDLLYSNKPVKLVEELQSVITEFNIPFEFDKIQNNEMRIRLYDGTGVFNDGDDAVRYMVYNATGDTLLIKSKEVIDEMASCKLPVDFLEKHAYVLSTVFNRHKKLIMAAKNTKNKSVINRISKMSKQNHKPIMESFSKKFISVAMNNGVTSTEVSKLSLRDKMKVLNLLEYKKLQNTTDAFIIRNGKIHTESNRPVYDADVIQTNINLVLDSMETDLQHLKNQKILLDGTVDYGMPISRKQTVGQLPYGSTVTVDGNISSGVYWKNEWGASDLDLSTIDLSGQRVGWGDLSGYTHNDIKFSGDVVNAGNGATEFMTSNKSSYGLFLNVYNGSSNSSYELVVGQQQGNSKSWVDNPIVREKATLSSRSNVIGFVKGNQYIAFNGRIGSSYISGGSKDAAIISRGLSKMWTIKELFSKFGIEYDDVQQHDSYDHDLTYSSFSFDKLEKLLNAGENE